jgi:hypothetical protein
MALFFAILGIVVGLAGAVLMYFFSDPATGSGIMLESFNPHREKFWARVGLGLVVLGSGLQTVAVVLASS